MSFFVCIIKSQPLYSEHEMNDVDEKMIHKKVAFIQRQTEGCGVWDGAGKKPAQTGLNLGKGGFL